MTYLDALSSRGSRSVQYDRLIAGARHEAEARQEATSPAPPPPSSWRDSTAFQVAMFASNVGAMGVSYARNHSVPWAIAHAIIGPAYLVYVGAETLLPPAEAKPAPAISAARRGPTGTRRPRRPYIG